MNGATSFTTSTLIWARLWQSVKNLAASEVGGKAKMMATALVLMSLSINGLNVLASYVGRDFMTAIAGRQTTEFVWLALGYVGVFTILTIVAVVFRFAEERLGLLWREWLTRRIVTFYLDHRVYYRLDEAGALSNPDQRIADDIRTFTVTTLSFTLMVLNGTFTVIAFSGVLWSISPLLFLASVAYAAGGTWFAIKLGRPLVTLNYRQLDREANFRSDLIHIRENAESVAMLHREASLQSRLQGQIDALVSNFKSIIAVNRNLGFFTTGYNYLIQVIPILFVAPMFMAGEVEFGVVTQAAVAFTALLGAFSLIVNQFQSISSYAAVASRLSDLAEAIEQAAPEAVRGNIAAVCAICAHPSAAPSDLNPADNIKVIEDPQRVAFEALTLRSPRDGRVLVDKFTGEMGAGRSVLIKGPDRAKLALFRATAGIWDTGEGRIFRPALEDILFLPERPYLPPGNLREILLTQAAEGTTRDEEILRVLDSVQAAAVLTRAGGLDREQDWDDLLSLGEQQSLAFARLLLAQPRFALLDRPGTALSVMQVRHMLRLLAHQDISWITLGDGDDQLADYALLLEFDDSGQGRWQVLAEPDRDSV
ncbi:ABC transporter ATP-binding protein/permease [Methylotetracoccus oryzae]|uniref:ABC transporter ATP-binding protein/permease n=1 Tax=Methylotetracoccus oryzae TaxID=1919059 RepID=UPI00111B7B50|nr:SbmA/BacA-like family transporter [Methylotetracoccus oryzae]